MENNACNRIKSKNPNIVTQGITDITVENISNGFGLSPCKNPTDYEHSEAYPHNKSDINDLIDCLIGSLSNELETYNVCNWKEFMLKTLGNIYNVLKIMNEDTCGINNIYANEVSTGEATGNIVDVDLNSKTLEAGTYLVMLSTRVYDFPYPQNLTYSATWLKAPYGELTEGARHITKWTTAGYDFAYASSGQESILGIENRVSTIVEITPEDVTFGTNKVLQTIRTKFDNNVSYKYGAIMKIIKLH